MQRGTVRKTVKTKSGARLIAVEKRDIGSKTTRSLPGIECGPEHFKPYRIEVGIAAEVSAALRFAPRFPRAWWEV